MKGADIDEEWRLVSLDMRGSKPLSNFIDAEGPFDGNI